MGSEDEDDPEDDDDEPQPVKVKDAVSKGRVKKNVLRSNPSSPGCPSTSRPSSPTLPENKGAPTGSQQVDNSDASPPPSPSGTGGHAGVSNPGKMTKEENVRRNMELIRNLSRAGSGSTAENEDDEVFILSRYYNLKLIKDKTIYNT